MQRLPDLPFGNAEARVAPDSKAAAEAWATMAPSICTLDVERNMPFAAKAAVRRVGELGVVAAAVTATKVNVDDSQGWQLIVPFYGHGTLKNDTTTMHFEGGRLGYLMPNLRRTTDCTTQMIVNASIDIVKLRATARTMVGGTVGQGLIEDRAHSVDMRRQREIFPAFQHLCSLIEATSANPHYANALGIEDSIYRWTVHALAMLPTETDSVPDEASEDYRLDVICDTVRTAHERPITLTEMECLSGLSARALQYAFKARFGCSPMEWQRRERMQFARSRLMFPALGETITDIAYAMGFSSSAAFATQYRRYFGETPSQTQRRAF
jgi:hypothetical protein